jgi:hypothetical protein
MSLLTKLKYINSNIQKGYIISSSAKFANKKFESFLDNSKAKEKANNNSYNNTYNQTIKKDINIKEENTNITNKYKENDKDKITEIEDIIKKKDKRFNFFELISLAFGIGLCGYVISLIKKKRKESVLLDKMNVKYKK